MAILQSCCCWRSLRTGSYVSAAYTTVYFSLTVYTMAMFLHEEHWGQPPVSDVAHKNGGGVRSFLEPEGISQVTLGFGVALLSCATTGILASLLLIFGLYSDRRVLLVPWVFTVLTTSLMDLGHTLYLLLLETMQFNPTTGILFTLDFFLLCLNVYSLLCVVSQYQEYKAGRGTAYHQAVPAVKYEVRPPPTTYIPPVHRRPKSFLAPLSPLLEVRSTPNDSPTAPLAKSLQENGVSSEQNIPKCDDVPKRIKSTKHVKFPDF